jgi:ubiquinone/menaquinone biosynthesis C-methylase UbiE
MREALDLAELRTVYGHLARRYDWQHALITARADQRGRRLLVENAVRSGDKVLDCGSGTGTTGIMAARKAGPNGRVTLFDLSDAMQAVARQKVVRAGLLETIDFGTGDMVRLPFDTGRFDVVLSTYSICPLYDPVEGALELYRVTRPGGMIGVAHSTEPRRPATRWIASRVERLAWHLHWLSMGCRPVEVLPALERAGVKVLFSRTIGVPLWPFQVFVVQKPAA